MSPELWPRWVAACTCEGCCGAPHDPPPTVRRRALGRRLWRSVRRCGGYDGWRRGELIGGRWAPVPMDCGAMAF